MRAGPGGIFQPALFQELAGLIDFPGIAAQEGIDQSFISFNVKSSTELYGFKNRRMLRDTHPEKLV
ncbi:hypothetical protein SDC9_183235 [bioreactor metagenome]|uniref:Uncharacterized protein n=1 Tax=bioreactor metagenome TaxID=1076179 RepID=A0A645HB47_9ZZZZ